MESPSWSCGSINDCESEGKRDSDARDRATDAQKDAADKFYDCIDDAETCDAAKACAIASNTSTSGGADAGSDGGAK